MTISLVTGGTGTIGSELVRTLLRRSEIVRIFSRDESSQHEMAQQLDSEGFHPDAHRFFIGDVRDPDRLDRALDGVDTVYHCAAMKHVNACEYNLFEAVQTNVLGVHNLIMTALRQGVKRVVNLSSDKAVDPANAMGSTKLLGERLAIQGNSHGACQLVSVRFGNVLGSRGSVWPLWEQQARKTGTITITDQNMTRFIMTTPQAVELCLDAAKIGCGGEIFVRRMPVMILGDLAAIFSGWFEKKHDLPIGSVKVQVIGPNPGETMSEDIATEEEAPRAKVAGNLIAIIPNSLFRQVDYSRYDKWKRFEGSRSSESSTPMSRESLRAFLIEAGLIK